MKPIRVIQYISYILWRVDRSAMGEEKGIRIGFLDGIDDSLRPFDSIIHGCRGVHYADRPTDRGSYVGYDGICSHIRHPDSFIRGGDVHDREQIHFRCESDHIHFFLKTHPCFFQYLPEMAIDDAMRWKIIDPG